MSNPNENKTDPFEELRKKAMVLIEERPYPDENGRGPADVLELLDELSIHQAELEIQNEELKRAQAELSELHREYVELYYEYAPCGYLALNRGGTIGRINLTGAALLEIDRAEAAYTPFWKFVHKESEDEYYKATRFLKGTKSRQNVELRLVSKKGRLFWARADIVPDLDESGEVYQYRMTLVDISERVKAEKELAALNATLEERVAERTERLSKYAQQLRRLTLSLSEIEDRTREHIALLLHDDLQQHLAATRFNLQLLLQDLIRDRTEREKFNEVEKLLAECIQKTRSLSYDLSPPVLRQSGLLPALEWLSGDMLVKHGFDVELKLNRKAEPESPAIASMLFQSIKELLFNSIKHSGVGEALVEAKNRGARLAISVADKGRGCIESEVREKQRHGSAFGLFKIEERIQFLGGEFEIDAAPGKGCRITLSLPKTSEEDRKNGLSSENTQTTAQLSDLSGAPAGRDKKIRILLADDHTAIREAMANLFENKEAFELVGQAANGAEAVRLAEKTRPDVVLMDVSMPGMDGVEATVRIGRMSPKTRVIGLSMHEDDATREKMLSAGAAAYHYKAAPLKSLIETIEKIRG
jgi:PAS domain S-box-containing protein